jgi:hypothetical protein
VPIFESLYSRKNARIALSIDIGGEIRLLVRYHYSGITQEVSEQDYLYNAEDPFYLICFELVGAISRRWGKKKDNLRMFFSECFCTFNGDDNYYILGIALTRCSSPDNWMFLCNTKTDQVIQIKQFNKNTGLLQNLVCDRSKVVDASTKEHMRELFFRFCVSKGYLYERRKGIPLDQHQENLFKKKKSLSLSTLVTIEDKWKRFRGLVRSPQSLESNYGKR